MDFVFEWCTDFREDDHKMKGTDQWERTARRLLLEKTKERVIWVTKHGKGKDYREGIRAVWLNPPDSWHLDTCGDHRELGDYRLTPLDKAKTRLDMVFQIYYDDPKEVKTASEWAKGPRKNWSAFATYLQADYEASLNQG